MYVDVFVIPVPENKLDEYKKFSRKCAPVWIKHGALTYSENAADDVQPGKVTSFPQSVKLEPGETVVVGIVTFASRKARDKAMEKIMADPVLAALAPGDMPFDGKRMFWGGFKPFLARQAKSE